MAAENPYQALIGADWDQLPTGVRLSHSCPLQASGTLHVFRADKGLAGFLARRLRLPPAGDNVPVALLIEQVSQGVQWARTFGDTRLDTLHTFEKGRLVEHFRPFSVVFLITAEGTSVSFQQVGLRLLGVRVPRFMGPQVWAKVTPGHSDRSWRIEVEIRHVWFGDICRYQGIMEKE